MDSITSYRIIGLRGLVLGLVLIGLVSGQGPTVTASSPAFTIYPGSVVYEEVYNVSEHFTGTDHEWAIFVKGTREITVTDVGPDTIRFTKKYTWEITEAYYKEDGILYSPYRYDFGYYDADYYTLQTFKDTTTHTINVVRDVRKSTGMRVRVENPMGLASITVIAQYQLNEHLTTSSSLQIAEFGSSLTHSNLICDNSAFLQIGDRAMGDIVTEYTTIIGRRALVLTPETPFAYSNKRYFDVVSGLYLGEEYIVITEDYEKQYIVTIKSQTVLDTDPPTINSPSNLEFEEGASNQQLIWQTSDAHPDSYAILQNDVVVSEGNWDGFVIALDISGLQAGVYEYICRVSDESGNHVQKSVHVIVTEVTPETTSDPPQTITIITTAPETIHMTTASTTSESPRTTVETTLVTITTEFFESPFTTQMGVTTPDSESDTPASFIPGFGLLLTLFGLGVLLWASRKRTKKF